MFSCVFFMRFQVDLPGQTLVVSCSVACNVSSEAPIERGLFGEPRQVHLATSCDATPTAPEPNTTLPVLLQQPVGYLPDEWVAVVDASNLQPGAVPGAQRSSSIKLFHLQMTSNELKYVEI